MDHLSLYLRQFESLNRGNIRKEFVKEGEDPKAPHKPILLLAVLDLIERKAIQGNQIRLTDELYRAYEEMWRALFPDRSPGKISYPIFHMANEPFWHLAPRTGPSAGQFPKDGSSLPSLEKSVDCAYLDKALWELLMNDYDRHLLRWGLLDAYFGKRKGALSSPQADEFDALKASIYQIDALSGAQRDILLGKSSGNQHLITQTRKARNAIFRTEIPKIYNYTCAISGYWVQAESGISLLDACHIIPHAQGGSDSVSNGIALTPILHRAFDGGLISIGEDYRVRVSPHFKENEDSPFNLGQFDGKKLHLPKDEGLWPRVKKNIM